MEHFNIQDIFSQTVSLFLILEKERNGHVLVCGAREMRLYRDPTWKHWPNAPKWLFGWSAKFLQKTAQYYF